jgi:hypothetical protein
MDKPNRIIKLESLVTKIPELATLYAIKCDAVESYNEAVCFAASESGLMPSTVSKYIAARASENYHHYKTKAMQMALVFDEVNET